MDRTESSGRAPCKDERVGTESDKGQQADDPRVVIIGRPGCHLCEEAERVVASVCGERGLRYQVRSIEDDPRLADEFAEYIPVTLVDGRRHDFYRVDPTRLAAALDR
jgi:glutaredoxin